MSLKEKKDIKINIDEHGFIENPDEWNENVAKVLAAKENIILLNDNHWLVINYIRNYFKENGITPMIQILCNNTGFSLKQIYELFPSGPVNGAYKIAGISKHYGCF